MQYREIDRSLDVEAEPSTDKQGTDHLGTAGMWFRLLGTFQA